MNVHEAKTNLSRLLEQAERGEEVIIARDGTPVARLVALPRKRVAGRLVGKMNVPDSFFDPMPEEFLEAFGPPMAPELAGDRGRTPIKSTKKKKKKRH